VHGLFFLLEPIVPADGLVAEIRNDYHRGTVICKHVSCPESSALMFFQHLLASDAIVLQPVRKIVGRGWPGHEAACPRKPGKPVKKVTEYN
jgi:hypothetical protein